MLSLPNIRCWQYLDGPGPMAISVRQLQRAASMLSRRMTNGCTFSSLTHGAKYLMMAATPPVLRSSSAIGIQLRMEAVYRITTCRMSYRSARSTSCHSVGTPVLRKRGGQCHHRRVADFGYSAVHSARSRYDVWKLQLPIWEARNRRSGSAATRTTTRRSLETFALMEDCSGSLA